ncbi:ArnT family glycosyltransferase [Marinicella gelatinilytica]|uniref:ArnT family glycosyltransferase n=1 Tax=Marinicella gelatinilytica TaxID=2996017 RepID=UPI0022610203|nr:glycosyltransferase family 39 protein [Marinicella gelatinilytica]MCX7544516.1 glycosyltransferase family 39 protein [Marinicella gelatinilytica]
MLTGTAKHRMFWGLLVSIMILQVLLAVQTELFGDEAFYWLESRFPQWSYSEVPGFVPWLNALSSAVLPQHPFFLRLPYLLACWSLPWLAFNLVKQISQSQRAAQQAALMTLILPLIGLMGMLAIADIWLVFFTVLAVFFLIRLMHSSRGLDAFYLGLTLMLAVNVHIRFWFMLFMALVAAAVIYKQSLFKQKTLWQITLPMTLLGFLSIFIFNVQHNFPLISFQLGERNPWQFQLSHMWFFLGQVIITTPLVFWLCVVSFKRPPVKANHDLQALHFMQLLAIMYWLLYAVLGFFSDNLRTNVHWPLPTYLLLLLVAASFSERHLVLKKWAVITGGLAQVLFLLGFYILLHALPIMSTNHKQLINNAIGWQELAAKTNELQQPGQTIIADHFMTAAALNYYYDDSQYLIPALPHPMNQKHGRQKQLALMNLRYTDSPNQSALLVVEHTALKLTQQISFYQNSCQQLNGLRLIDDLSVRHGSKIYYFFHSNAGECDIPPIIYHDYQHGLHSGWVMVKKEDQAQLDNIDVTDTLTPISSLQTLSLGQNELFKAVNAADYQRLSYQLESRESIQLIVSGGEQNIVTQRFYSE